MNFWNMRSEFVIFFFRQSAISLIAEEGAFTKMETKDVASHSTSKEITNK